MTGLCSCERSTARQLFLELYRKPCFHKKKLSSSSLSPCLYKVICKANFHSDKYGHISLVELEDRLQNLESELTIHALLQNSRAVRCLALSYAARLQAFQLIEGEKETKPNPAKRQVKDKDQQQDADEILKKTALSNGGSGCEGYNSGTSNCTSWTFQNRFTTTIESVCGAVARGVIFVIPF